MSRFRSDTPRRSRMFMHNPASMDGMSDYGLRARRANHAPTVLLQGRVSPEARNDVKEAAEASGVTMSYYLEALITKLVDENGGMPLVDPPLRDSTNQIPELRRSRVKAA